MLYAVLYINLLNIKMIEDRTKEQIILDAAEKEFMTKGYEGAKTTSIAAAAGVTHAMLHYYFRTKENLFNKVFESKIVLLKDSILSSFARTDLPLLERIKNGIEAHFDFLAQNPDLPRFVVNELISKPEHLNRLGATINMIAGSLYDNMQNDFEAEQKKGSIEKINGIDLLLDIVSLNVFVFVAYPIIEAFSSSNYGSREEFLAARKRENVEIIMRRLVKR